MPRRLRSTAKIMHRATELRNESTDPEIRLWQYLRLRRLNKVRFRTAPSGGRLGRWSLEAPSPDRQHAIGRYVVDFCAPEATLVIELDGSQHIEQAKRDEERTRYLEKQGYRVLRFWNDQVLKDINGVVIAIQDALGEEGA